MKTVISMAVGLLALILLTSFSVSGIARGAEDSGSGGGSSSGSSGSGSGSGSGSSGGSSGNNEKSSGDGGSNSGSNDNNAGNSPDTSPKLKEATPTKPADDINTIPPTEESKKTDEKPTCMIPEGCGQNPINPHQPTTPDKGCAFHPDSDKCKPDQNGNCPPGFAHNVHGNCFPSGKCPSGFGRHDNDETGKCFRNFNPGHSHNHGSSSSHNNNSPNHSISDKCFSQIKIAWLAKIQRGQNSQIDSIINKCLGVA